MSKKYLGLKENNLKVLLYSHKLIKKTVFTTWPSGEGSGLIPNYIYPIHIPIHIAIRIVTPIGRNLYPVLIINLKKEINCISKTF